VYFPIVLAPKQRNKTMVLYADILTAFKWLMLPYL